MKFCNLKNREPLVIKNLLTKREINEVVSAHQVKQVELELLLTFENLERKLKKKSKRTYKDLELEDVLLQNYARPSVNTSLVEIIYMVEVHFIFNSLNA
mmetsp:Transcript_27757/g.26815  ORF Transcript_27757/g.26815 Transcript_27757/m.26815 type:complete len:99 (+) Transcript_27757:733-1029(+)